MAVPFSTLDYWEVPICISICVINFRLIEMFLTEMSKLRNWRQSYTSLRKERRKKKRRINGSRKVTSHLSCYENSRKCIKTDHSQRQNVRSESYLNHLVGNCLTRLNIPVDEFSRKNIKRKGWNRSNNYRSGRQAVRSYSIRLALITKAQTNEQICKQLSVVVKIACVFTWKTKPDLLMIKH